jgi:UDP-N-acetylmuramate--alanine ligase
MTAVPLSIGTLHFVGIGGIGMSGIAEIMHNLGYHVQGSDIASNSNVKRLVEMGITIHIGHKASNIAGSKVLVVSSAVKKDNPEVIAAREKLIPVVRRAEMLAELMRLKWSIAVGGTHGKTTTTTMVAAMLEAGLLDPTVINGGIINAYGTNAHLGAGEWVVAEADESDGTFVKLPARIAIITNIDPEHLDFYGTFDNVKESFKTFVENIPFYGLAILCTDHPEVQSLVSQISDRRILTYGFNPQADIRAVNLTIDPKGAHYDVIITDRLSNHQIKLNSLFLPMFGEHNVQNSLAAIAVAIELGLSHAMIRQGLSQFSGVKRRFTKTGVVNNITIIDDYGHHPVEIAAVLHAARSATQGQVIAVIQPHRYSRLESLFEDFCTCFNDADIVLVADVYAAGETPIEGIDRHHLIEGLLSHGHRKVLPLEDPHHLAQLIYSLAKSGDYVICLGAGTITSWANSLPLELEALQ